MTPLWRSRLSTRPWGDIDVYIPSAPVAAGLAGEALSVARKAAAIAALTAVRTAVGVYLNAVPTTTCIGQADGNRDRRKRQGFPGGRQP